MDYSTFWHGLLHFLAWKINFKREIDHLLSISYTKKCRFQDLKLGSFKVAGQSASLRSAMLCPTSEKGGQLKEKE